MVPLCLLGMILLMVPFKIVDGNRQLVWILERRKYSTILKGSVTIIIDLCYCCTVFTSSACSTLMKRYYYYLALKSFQFYSWKDIRFCNPIIITSYLQLLLCHSLIPISDHQACSSQWACRGANLRNNKLDLFSNIWWVSIVFNLFYDTCDIWRLAKRHYNLLMVIQIIYSEIYVIKHYIKVGYLYFLGCIWEN